MAAATADRDTKFYGEPIEDTFIITTAATLYIGTLVNFVSGTGRVTNATAATSRMFAGMVVGLPDGSGLGNTSGTTRARVAWGCIAKFTTLTALRTFSQIGKNVFVSTNQEVTDTTGAGTSAVRVKVGTLIKFDDANKTTGYIWLRVFGATDAT